MKHMKIVDIPATSKEVVEFVTCDICKEKIASCRSFAVEEIEVRHKTGTNYPGGGNGTEVSFDICCKCFDHKIIPFLVSQGAEPRTREWDW